jgi:dTDP-4-amino-4,6-dideoxygalactose transaminase
LSQPFLPFTRPSIDEATIAAVGDVLRSGWITSGPKVRELEAALSAYCHGRSVRVLNSGTATLELALRLANVGPGDEVVTTPLSWVATANVVLTVGARPVFVDVDPVTRNIDLDRMEAAITPRTRALIPVDLAGLPVDRDRLYAIARKHGVRIVEDAAQAFGASWRGEPIGSHGDFVSFSFHANKNVTTTEGGALVVPDEDTAQRLERLRLQGVVRSGEDGMDVPALGYKFNLTDVAACIGLGQLRRLDEFTARRRHLAKLYFERWDARLGCELPPADFEQSNWHMFQPILPIERMRGTRADFIRGMREAGIGVGVHYPAMHLFTLFRAQGWKAGDFPHAERLGAGTVTLPLFPAMADSDVDRVCSAAAAVLGPLLK